MKLNDLINWIKIIRKNCEITINSALQERNLESWTFHRGKAEALEDFEDVLTKVEQDLTLQELKDFCKIADDGCKTCPFALWDTDEDGERFMYNCDINAPHYCDVEEITKKVRGVQ